MKNQNVGRIETVVLAEVKFPEYQRGVKKISAKISKNLIVKAIGTPKLARRRADGSLNCLDGMQRITALIENGYETWRCEVIECDDEVEEAQIFQRVNQDRETVNTYDRFRAAIIANDKDAVVGDFVLKKYGPRMGYTANANLKNEVTIGCPATVYKCVKLYGGDVFDKTIDMITKTWPNNPQIFKNSIIVALCKMNKQFGDALDVDRFTVMLSKLSSRQVLQMIDNRAGGAAVLQAVDIFITYYNRGLRSNRLHYNGK